MRIVSTSKIQKNISILSDNKNIYTIINNGEAKTMLIPYYEWLQKVIENYLEDIEIQSNRDALQKKYIESKKSGLSTLVI